MIFIKKKYISIEFFGVSFLRITTSNNTKILIDPFINGNPDCHSEIKDFENSDIILVTHGSWDHFGNTIEIMKKNNSDLICGPAVGFYVEENGINNERIHSRCWGDTVKIKDIKVKVVQTAHLSVFKANNKLFSGIPVGFIIESEEGIRIYSPGDTSIFSDIKLFAKLYQPQIAAMPVSYPPNEPEALHLSPYEAALATKWLNVKNVIPVHFNEGSQEPNIFKKFMNKLEPSCSVNILKPGSRKIFEYDASEIVTTDRNMNIEGLYS